MPTKTPRTTLIARERDKKIKWLRALRKRVQYFSLALRPQRVRMMWVKDLARKEM